MKILPTVARDSH